MIHAYRNFARTYYTKNGQPTKEFTEMKLAARPVRKLYGKTSVTDFGPLALKSVRTHMVKVENLSRGVINNRINRIKRIFKWAVSEELIPASVYEALRTVVGLKFGRTEARETEPVKPVLWESVEPVLEACSSPVRIIIQLQSLLKPFLEDINHESDFLFSPIKAEAERQAKRRQNRKTPLTPSQAKRKAKSHPKRGKRCHYDVDSYRRAIKYAIKTVNKTRDEAAKLPEWYPLQLRHSRATEIRKQFGLEAAQVVLGHKRADITEVYAERNLEQAIGIAKQIG